MVFYVKLPKDDCIRSKHFRVIVICESVGLIFMHLLVLTVKKYEILHMTHKNYTAHCEFLYLSQQTICPSFGY